MLADATEPALMYALETAMQMYIVEMSEPLRELYVTAYSLPSTSEYIMKSTASKLQQIFSSYLPQAELRDFYEMEIASGGVMRAFMARPCDMYFTMERKLSRFLQSTLTLYSLPADKQQEIIQKVVSMDLKQKAQQIIQTTIAAAESGAWEIL